MTENNYNKYLKYKKKYLNLANQLGGAHTPEQIEFHNLLKSMDNDFFVSGFTGAYQWYNDDPDAKTPKTVTIIGEYHHDYHSFGNCNVKTKTGEPAQNRQNMTVIELFHKLFKGTNNCIDFYLEDWILHSNNMTDALQNDFMVEYLNWTPDDISPPINPTVPGENYREFTIENLVRMTNTDIVPPPPHMGLRKDVKKYPNVRLHTTEFRNAYREYILLPYDASWFEFKIPGMGKRICKRLVNNEVELNFFLTRLKQFMYLLSGIYPEPTADRSYDYLIKNPMETDSIPMLNSIYYDILVRSYNMGNGAGGYNLIRPDRSITPGNADLDNAIQLELETYINMMRKNLSNLRKYDTITLKKYIDFFLSCLNVNLHINNIKRDFPRLRFNSVRLFELLQKLVVYTVDIYSISRSLKIFSLKDQSRNLTNDSLCYNQFGINNRNIILYAMVILILQCIIFFGDIFLTEQVIYQ